MLIEAELLPQGPQFASNIPRFGEEPEKLTKMLPEPDNTILMSDCPQSPPSLFYSLALEKPTYQILVSYRPDQF